MAILSNLKNFPLQLLLLISAVILLISNVIGLARPVKSLTDFVFSPWAFFADNSAKSLENVSQSVVQASKLKSEYDELRLKYSEIESKLAQYSLLKEENETLKQQLGISLPSKDEFIEAEVMVGEGKNMNDFIIINKGSIDKVKIGDIVSVGDSYIGSIVDVGAVSSKVRLPTSRASFIKVIISKQLNLENPDLNKLFSGVAVGYSNEIRVENIDNASDVAVGDSIIIVDERVGKYMYLGKIKNVSDNPAASSKLASLEPTFNYSDLRFVFVSKR